LSIQNRQKLRKNPNPKPRKAKKYHPKILDKKDIFWYPYFVAMDKDITIKTENACPADYAIKVSGVSKTFRIFTSPPASPASPNRGENPGGPHEKISRCWQRMAEVDFRNSFKYT
jgi:hypothetical protein